MNKRQENFKDALSGIEQSKHHRLNSTNVDYRHTNI